MTSLLNDEKCVKILAVYIIMHEFVHKPMGIYLVVWYLQSGVIVVIKSIKIILFSFNSVNGVARILFLVDEVMVHAQIYHPARI